MSPDFQTVQIIPAIMPEDVGELKSLAECVSSFTHAAQLDVMDGKFVPSVSWPYQSKQWVEFESLQNLPFFHTLAYEVHLMIEEPELAGLSFIHKGARRIIGHVEAMGHANDALTTIHAWQSAGVEVGISLLLSTPLSEIEPLMPDVDFVQVMGIAEIGYQGHAFDERTYERLEELRERFPEKTLTVDGGVKMENAKKLVQAGANRLAVGSAIMKSEKPAETFSLLQKEVWEH